MDLTYSPRGRGVPRRGPLLAGGQPRRRVRRAARQGRSRARARGATTSGSPGTGTSPQHGWTCLGWPDGARRPRAAAVPAGDLPRGVRPRRRARPGQPPRRGAARPDADRLRHRGAEGSASCRGSWPSRSCGARATPSPAPAPTWPTSPPRPRPRRRRVGRSTARRCGPRWPTSPTGASCVARTEPGSQAAPGPVLPAGADGPGRRRGPRRSIQLTGTSEFNEVFFTGARTDADLSSASRATAGRSRWARSASSAASPRSASRSASSASSTPCSSWPARNGAFDDPVAPRPARPGPGRARGDPAQRAAHALRARTRRPSRPASPSCSGPAGTAPSASSRCRSAAPTR